MTAVLREVRRPEDRDAEDRDADRPTGADTLRSVWTLLPTLTVLNLVVTAMIFAGSSVTGAAPWASVCLYPVPTLWLLILLEQVLVHREGHGVTRVRAVLSAAMRSVWPALALGAPVCLVMLSALVAGQLWLSVHAIVMLVPLVLGAAVCSVATITATTAARKAALAALAGRTGYPLSERGLTVKEALANPGRGLAAACCLTAIPALVMALNPGVLLAIPAPFALCALLASRTSHPVD